MVTGTVKFFNEAKGWGFLVPDDGSAHAFVHFKSINTEGFKTLKEGQRVEYTTTKGEKGLNAVNVCVVGD